MAKPVDFGLLETESLEEALKFIEIPIRRFKIFNEKDQKIEGFQQLIRTDTNATFGIVTSFYKFAKHEEILKLVTQKLKEEKVPYRIKSIAYDRGGAIMFARLEIKKEYSINGAKIAPELVLLNSYNSIIRMGFDLWYVKKETRGLVVAPELKTRAVLFGINGSPEKLIQTALIALDIFEKKTIPQYEKLAASMISSLQVKKILKRIESQKILPIKQRVIVENAIESRIKEASFSLWDLYGVLCETIGQLEKEVSPNRFREIHQKISDAFKNGGERLLKTKPRE